MKNYCNQRRTIRNLKAIAWFTASFTTLVTGAYLNGYRLNTSHSYPPGVYQLKTQAGAYQTGDLVLFCPPSNEVISTAIARGYLDAGRCKSGSVPIIKRIAALENDGITLNDVIHVNGHPLSRTTIQARDNEHRPLTPFTPKGQRFTLPPDTAFMYSDYAPEASFDSRYFGWVAIKDIQGRIKPVWTVVK